MSMCSLTFDWRNSKSGLSVRVPTLSREPVMRLSSASTRMPRPSRAWHRCEPMKPAPPETTARSLVVWLVAADTPISETEIAHGLRVAEVAPVDDHGPAHRGFDAAEVEAAELVPFRDHDQSVCALGEGIRITRGLDLRQLDSPTFHRGGSEYEIPRDRGEPHPPSYTCSGRTEGLCVR